MEAASGGRRKHGCELRGSSYLLQNRVVDIALGAVGKERVAFWRIERRAGDEALQQVGIREVQAAEYGGIGAALRDQRRGTVPGESTAEKPRAGGQRPQQGAVREGSAGPRERPGR